MAHHKKENPESVNDIPRIISPRPHRSRVLNCMWMLPFRASGPNRSRSHTDVCMDLDPRCPLSCFLLDRKVLTVCLRFQPSLVSSGDEHTRYRLFSNESHCYLIDKDAAYRLSSELCCPSVTVLGYA